MAVPKSHLEIERKYDAEPDFVLPKLTGLSGVATVSDPETHQLVANYFDTDDFRLARHGITLRRRRGGSDAGWHLKIPAGSQGKQELHAPLGRSQTVPGKLAALVAAYTRGAPLRPVATLETGRTVVLLRDKTGKVLAEVADDAVIGQVLDGAVTGAAEGTQPPISAWREIEIELVEGSPTLLKEAGKRLRKAGARKGGSASKLSRVLAPVMPPAPNGTAADGTAGAAVVDYLAAQIRAILSQDPRARLGEDDAVHKMRVAVRRIRSVLKSYRRVLDRERTDPLQPELKWLADELGAVRDLEVLRMRFTDRLAGLSGPAGHAEINPEQSWLATLADEEAAAYRRLNVALKEPRYFALLDALDALVAEPPLTDRAGRKASKEIPRTVASEWRRLERSYAAIEGAENTDEARHETRKTAKRTRYAAELAAASLTGSASAQAKRTAGHAEELQEVFGGFQDGVIAMERIRTIAARVKNPNERFALGVLYGVEHCTATRSLDQAAQTWERARLEH
jgi:CHAD domain-containing protein